MLYEDGEIAQSFVLREPGGMMYVTQTKVVVECGDSRTIIPVPSVISCHSQGRILYVVWQDNMRLRLSVRLEDMPAAAAETAILGALR